jgi:hypothetical protein
MTAAPRFCAHCGGDLDAPHTVYLNGASYHVESCFAEGLKALKFKLADIAIAMGAGMDPLVAYRAGKQTVTLLVASRRRRKKRS